MDDPIVRVAHVHKFFTRGSEQIDVLNDLSLVVQRGEFVGLMGPSGSGKTTLLNLIAGLDRPSEGEVWVRDQRISRMSEGELARWRTRNVGFIFQFYHLLPVLTAYENVELPLLLLPLSAAERKQQVLTALDLVGLSNRLSHRPGQLSGGQQQRVGITRAIVTHPTLIVADDLIGALWIARNPKLFRLVVKNLRRKLSRMFITSTAIIVFVLMGTIIWTVVNFLDRITTQKARDFKMLVTERYQVPSMMPLTHAN